ncbi:hypothetical protein AB0N07_27490 [Streptomyces sp. NPDC051172]|uniref:hypothetical protein n=1 Tax=Streptomyces sp. NPDC051172 TaxID=3155796 RepID=UPI00343B0BE6
MRFLRRLRGDLSAGENLELYVTALLSLTLAVLGVFDVAGGKVLAAATLATLALLAGSLLGSRRQIADLAAEVRAGRSGEVSAADFFRRDSPRPSNRSAPHGTSGSSASPSPAPCATSSTSWSTAPQRAQSSRSH